MKTFEELRNLVIEWSAKRGIIPNGNLTTQRLKLAEEVGELAAAIVKGKDDLVKDAIGDCAVVIINCTALDRHYYHNSKESPTFDSSLDMDVSIEAKFMDVQEVSKVVLYTCGFYKTALESLHHLACRYGWTLHDCLEAAYEEIKDRNGTLLPNGNFLKEEDYGSNN